LEQLIIRRSNPTKRKKEKKRTVWQLKRGGLSSYPARTNVDNQVFVFAIRLGRPIPPLPVCSEG